MTEIRTIATGLRFPEGPVAMKDGSVVLVEIERQTVTRVRPDGSTEVIAHTGGGPNGLAVGPDGAFYVCNNGGFMWRTEMNLMRPAGPASDYTGGRIERVDPKTGAVTVLYDHCGPHKLLGPNDIVFDGLGGFYFTDLGKARARDRDWGGVYYALADGSKITEVAHPILTPNGIGLSPDGKTLYVAETETARLWAFDVLAPGVLAKEPFPSPHGGRLMVGSGRVPALRQPGGRWRGQRLRRDVGQRLGQRGRAGRRADPADRDAGHVLHQHLLRRAGFENRVPDAFRFRQAGCHVLAGSWPAIGLRRLKSHRHARVVINLSVAMC